MQINDFKFQTSKSFFKQKKSPAFGEGFLREGISSIISVLLQFFW
jgi:hypothetical protein